MPHDWQMQPRQLLGLEIAAMAKVERKGGVWLVPSQSGHGRYTVCPDPADPHCSCPDHSDRGVKCKHLWAVEFVSRREQNADGSTTVEETVRITKTTRTQFTQDWTAYNKAQTNEKRDLQVPLSKLVKTIPDDVLRNGNRGRPSAPLWDFLFGNIFKVYSTFSGRRFNTDLEEAHKAEYISCVPHYNTLFTYMERRDMTPILHELILTAASPLAGLATGCIAVDSTGFSSSRLTRWYEANYRGAKEHLWVKAHIACDPFTNVITAAEIAERDSSDPKQVPALLAKTKARFAIREFVADKGYSTVPVHNAVFALGATPYIPFKSNATGSRGGDWQKAFHFFKYHRDKFDPKYHQRSNIESTNWMVKSKLREEVRSKHDVSMLNEVLSKFICHNLCCVIQSVYEFGVEAEFFGPDESNNI